MLNNLLSSVISIRCTFTENCCSNIKIDELVKSRHSGENRSPDGLQLLEKTGFRLSPE